MIGPQLHLLLNHFPIIGFALLCPLILFSWWRKNRAIKLLTLAFVALIGLSSLPAFWTGEPAEEAIENLAGVSAQQIEKHEDAAKTALFSALMTSVLALSFWIIGRRREALLNTAMPLVLAAVLLTAALMAWVGHEGGKIRHPEIAEDVQP